MNGVVWMNPIGLLECASMVGACCAIMNKRADMINSSSYLFAPTPTPKKAEEALCVFMYPTKTTRGNPKVTNPKLNPHLLQSDTRIKKTKNCSLHNPVYVVSHLCLRRAIPPSLFFTSSTLLLLMMMLWIRVHCVKMW